MIEDVPLKLSNWLARHIFPLDTMSLRLPCIVYCLHRYPKQLLRWNLAEWHRNTELMPRYLSPEQAATLQRHCDQCLMFYLKLAGMAVASSELLFPCRPKLHVTQQ